MRNKSFTLIELLIVIAVIGLLSSIVLVNLDLPKQREKARVARSLNFSLSIQNALGSEGIGTWTFDDCGGDGSVPTTLKDTSGYGNTGTNNGAVCREDTPHKVAVTGTGRYALSFAGANYVDAGDNNTDVTSSGVSVEAWVKFASDAAGVDYSIVSKKTGFSDASGYFLYYENNQLYWNAGFSGGFIELAGGAGGSNLGTSWRHIVGTTNGTDMYIYVDGIQTNSRKDASNGNIAANAQTSKIGYSGFGPAYWMNGFIDEVRIYSRALSVVEIQKHYVEGLPRHKLIANGTERLAF